MALASDSQTYAFGTKEWAEKNANIINGCAHNCIYCYAREMAIRFHRKTTDDWHNEVVRQNRKKKYQHIDGYYMYATTHDISVGNLSESIIEIHKILDSRSKILIVSKPHLRCVQRICEEFQGYKDMILFRFTIGSADDKVLKFWEPAAPKFQERLESLRWAFNHGYQTSVSSEPMLDDKIDDVVNQARQYVTATIWLGKANRLKGRLAVNGFKDRKYMDAADQLEKWQSDENIMALYERYKDNSMIEWKESIKKVVDRAKAAVGGY